MALVKALTLIEPYASLVDLEAKLCETRGRALYYKGPLVIHAAKAIPDEYAAMLDDPDVVKALGQRKPADFNLGCALCLTNMLGCVRTTELHKLKLIEGFHMRPQEFKFGNYAPNRWVYALQYLGRFPRPIPMRGYQGLWDCEIDISNLINKPDERNTNILP